MSIVCVWSPGWSTGEGLGADLSAVLPAVLAEVAPRVCVESRRVWVDGRGLRAVRLAESLLERLAAVGVGDARAGVAGVAVAAWMAARGGGTSGGERGSEGEGGGGAGERGARESGAGSGERGSISISAPQARISISSPKDEPEAVPSAARRGARARKHGIGLAHEIGRGVVVGLEVENEIGREIGIGAFGSGDSASPRGASPWGPRIAVVPPGRERAFLAPLPLAWLEADERVLGLLEGVGVTRCGELATLEREAVEVRFGAEGVAVWRLARGEDERRLFAPIPSERPSGSMEFLGYAVTDPERLVFTANALLGSICDRLRERGEHARRMRLVLPLGNGETWERSLRPARATASRAVWLRLVRGALERLTVPDAVVGVTLEVEAVEVAAVRQGDLFDRGFATASAVEAAVLRLLESQGEVVVRPEVGRHPLVERRTRWVAATAEWESGGVEEGGKQQLPALPLSLSPTRGDEGGDASLALRLLPQPRGVQVETAWRRGSAVPVRFRDGSGWREVVTVAGPDRISGGQWEAAYAREYYRAVASDGVMVWLFRDAVTDAWFLHGWWD